MIINISGVLGNGWDQDGLPKSTAENLLLNSYISTATRHSHEARTELPHRSRRVNVYVDQNVDSLAGVGQGFTGQSSQSHHGTIYVTQVDGVGGGSYPTPGCLGASGGDVLKPTRQRPG